MSKNKNERFKVVKGGNEGLDAAQQKRVRDALDEEATAKNDLVALVEHEAFLERSLNEAAAKKASMLARVTSAKESTRAVIRAVATEQGLPVEETGRAWRLDLKDMKFYETTPPSDQGA